MFESKKTSKVPFLLVVIVEAVVTYAGVNYYGVNLKTLAQAALLFWGLGAVLETTFTQLTSHRGNVPDHPYASMGVFHPLGYLFTYAPNAMVLALWHGIIFKYLFSWYFIVLWRFFIVLAGALELTQNWWMSHWYVEAPSQSSYKICSDSLFGGLIRWKNTLGFGAAAYLFCLAYYWYFSK